MNQDVAKTSGGAVSDAEFERMMREDSGVGISKKAADNLVPRITLLQPLSPLVVASGASAGDFVLGNDVVKGATGFYFQPAHLDQVWLEFKPLDEGGGFVAAHPFTEENDPPRGARKYKPFKWQIGPDNNELIHYRQLAGIAWRDKIGLEFVLPFKSTGHTVAREWNTRMGRTNVLPDGRARSIFAHAWKLTSTMVKKGPYTYFIVSVGDPVLLASETANDVVGDFKNAYLRGRQLEAAFTSGAKVAAAPTEERDDIGQDEAADERAGGTDDREAAGF